MWLAGLPSAGWKAPLWQLAHCAVTVTCVWFHRLGFQVLGDLLWQLMQLVLPTGMCVAGLPEAVVPLWQLAQLVAAV